MITASIHRLFSLLVVLTGALLLPACGKRQPKAQQHALEQPVAKKEKKKNEKSEGSSYIDYEQKIVAALEKGSKRHAQEHLQKLIDEYPDDQRTALYRLQLADLYFEEGKKKFDNDALKAAYELYKKFYTLSPSDEKAEYASYRAILSTFYQTHRIDCDTQSLEETLTQCRKHLERSEFIRQSYHKDVRDISYTCERKLIDKDLYVFRNYLRQDKLQSAGMRLEYLREHHLPKHADLAAQLLYLECKLARKKKEEEVVGQKVALLQEEYPNSEYTVLATRLKENKGFLF